MSSIDNTNFNLMTKQQLVNGILPYDHRASSTLMRKNKDELIELYRGYTQHVLPIPDAPQQPTVWNISSAQSVYNLIRQRRQEREDLEQHYEHLINDLANDITFTPVELPKNLYGDIETTLSTIVTNHPNRNFLISYGENMYTLNANTFNRLSNLMRVQNVEELNDYSDSDRLFLANLYTADYITIQQIAIPRNTGGYFPFFTKFEQSNLAPLGIAHNSFEFVDENCLVHSLSNMGLSQDKLNTLKTFIKGKNTPKNKLKEISNALQVNLIIYHPDSNNKKRTTQYGKTYTEQYKICLIHNHYFPYIEKLPYTRFALSNYQKVKNHPKWFLTEKINKNNVINITNDQKRLLSSYDIVALLVEHQSTLLTPINKISPIMFQKNNPKIDPKNFDDFDSLNVLDHYDTIQKGNNMKNLFAAALVHRKEEKTSLDQSGYHTRKYRTYTRKQWNTLDQKLKDTLLFEDDGKSDEINTSIKYKRIFFDFETYPHGPQKIHKPYLCSYFDNTTKQIKTFTGWDCATQMLNSFDHHVLLYAHNAGYDFRFILNFIKINSYLPAGRTIFTATGSFKNKSKDINIQIIVKDSAKLIPKRLCDFGSMFNLDAEKEIMPYDMVTFQSLNGITSFQEVRDYYNKIDAKKSIEKSFKVKIPYVQTYDEYIQSFKDNVINQIKLKFNIQPPLNKQSDAEKMIQNIIDWNLWTISNKNGTFFRLEDYSAKYCEIDCEVLAKGFNIFRQSMFDATSIDIDDYVSIASVGIEHLKRQNVFEGVCELSNIYREFIQRCVVGGRTMSARNEKFILGSEALDDTLKNWLGADFDAVSLYPSAMHRLGGFLKGQPKVIETDHEKSMNFLNTCDGYFVKIHIYDVQKHRDFPLLSFINKKTGVRTFSNNMEGHEIFIDKIGLEDAINYHNIKFKVIQGLYFNEGRNNKITDVINTLFQERLRIKKEDPNNPLQEVYKLLMNSSYGRTIMKPINTSNKFVVGYDNMIKYVSQNYDTIDTIQIIQKHKSNNKYDRYLIKSKEDTHKHRNYAQCGVEILSMSKRIMNEVMCLAEDNDLPIYYQDTDSMHIDINHVDILANLFKQKFDRDLIGKQMGQFHVDFDLKGADNNSLVASETIILGKKCYIDKIEGISSDRQHMITGFHVRMKGVSNESIWYTTNEENDIMKLYKDLYNGNKIPFDLCCGGKTKMWKFNKDMTVSFLDGITDNGFVRNIQFS